MRFHEEYNAYYFSKNPATDPEERSIIIDQAKEYVKEYAGNMFRPEDSVGGTVKKYCYWFNHDYIKQIIDNQ